ncbi:glucose 1-dehydrogenase [Rhodococcus erythropolis]|uniref:glucose 1-dehydrogenase n=1 Tax=Rhodococcus erythropolis TaxID=1833 RepID=UPI00294A2168|nr:glucose 1-dehydrogenase [Rhodococcus erythropolis]MDV6278708.1 glucose 1-dehydrogenase [Rhodococcus erythropolis]
MMTISTLLAGKTILITGAASGIGAAAAIAFSAHGAKVSLADINTEGGEKLAHTIEGNGGSAMFVPTDVGSAHDVESMVQATISRFGHLDCAFNNAGIDGDLAPLHETTEENWNRVIAVNLTGVLLCLKYEITHMLGEGHGSIVNNSSVAGLIGMPYGISSYAATKHGVIGLTKVAALEYGARGIRVNAVCPGIVRTNILDQAIRDGVVTEQEAAAIAPIRRLASPSEIAEAAAWLCSDAASYVNGHAMAVDGGITAM